MANTLFFSVHSIVFATETDSPPKYSCLNQFVGENHPCKIGQPYPSVENDPVNIAVLPNKPSYFFRASLTNDDAYVIGEFGNIIVNMKSHKVTPMPGQIDPVPTPDGRYISVPEGALRIYRRTEDGAFKVVFSDDSMQVNYQSIGVLRENSAKVVYRIVAQAASDDSDNGDSDDGDDSASAKKSNAGKSAKSAASQAGGLLYWEYEADKRHPDSFQRLQSGALCVNLTGGVQLPRVSQDGKMIGLFDSQHNVTKIYEIRGDQCVEKFNLGVPTGKVDFSPDGSKVVFHAPSIYLSKAENSSIFENPSPQQGMNIFIYSLKDHRFTPVTNNVHGHSYYPAFKNNNEVIFLHTDRGQSVPIGNLRGKHPESPYSLRTARFDTRRSAPARVLLESCGADWDKFSKLVALGKLWSEACLNTPLELQIDSGDKAPVGTMGELSSASAAFFRALSLEPKECKNLVDQCWAEMESNIKNYGGEAFHWNRPIEGNQTVDNGSGSSTTFPTIHAAKVNRADFGDVPGDGAPEPQAQNNFEPKDKSINPLGKQVEPPRFFTNLTKQDLLAACPSVAFGTSKFPIVASHAKAVSPLKAFQNLVSGYCSSCHGTATIPFADPTRLQGEKAQSGRYWVDEMLLRLNSTDPAVHMPRGEHQPSDVALKQAIKYLKSLKPTDSTPGPQQ